MAFFPVTYQSPSATRLRFPGFLGAGLFLLSAFLLSISASSEDTAQDTSPEARGDLFDRVIANQKRTDEALDIFERIERMEIRKTGSDAKPFDVKTWRVFPAGTGTDRIPLGPDAQPIQPENYRAELQKLEKLLVWAAQDGPGQREAYAKVERKRKERNDLISATHEAFLFSLIGHEMRGDRNLVKYSMVPNPKFKPTTRFMTMFAKVRGTIWIDEESRELAKIEGHVSEDISIALFLAKVYKGSYFMQERYEMAPGVWLPSYQQYDFDGRKYLMSISIHERTLYSNYRRVGPPKEALGVVRGELSKLASERADP